MPYFLVAGQLPDNYDPSRESEELIRNIHALNAELEAAGALFFVGGLEPVSRAKTLRKQSDGSVSITDGPFLEAKEHVGGLSILKCADMDEAVAWARKATLASGMPAEVRQIFFRTDDDGDAQ